MKFYNNKSFKLTLILVLAISMFICTYQFKSNIKLNNSMNKASKSKENQKLRVRITENKLEDKPEKKVDPKANVKDSTNSTSGSSENISSHKAEEDMAKPGINVIGKNETHAVIDASPFKVKKCDEVLSFEAKTLDTLDNFKQQSSKYFTMSMYTINQFKEKKIFSFEKLVTLAGIQETPEIVKGSVSCVSFQSYYRTIYICMKDEAEANNILDAYSQFMKCRMNNNLKQNYEKPQAKIQNILNRACMGLDISFDTSKYKNPVEAEAALTLAINNTLKKLVDKTDDFITNSLTTNVSVKPEEKIPSYQFH